MDQQRLRAETEKYPAMEVHLSGAYFDHSSNPSVLFKHCIIWIDGTRWEGDLREVKDGTSPASNVQGQ